MPEPVLDVTYWRERLTKAQLGDPENLHHAIFRCSASLWKRIAEQHRKILAKHIQPLDSVLDCGCGWGRLFDLMPKEWRGGYAGIDLSPDFIWLAQLKYPLLQFRVRDLQDLTGLQPQLPDGTPTKIDWAILISIRPMMRRNLGDEVWVKMETEIRRVASKLLYLEYDEHDQGSVE